MSAPGDADTPPARSFGGSCAGQRLTYPARVLWRRRGVRGASVSSTCRSSVRVVGSLSEMSLSAILSAVRPPPNRCSSRGSHLPAAAFEPTLARLPHCSTGIAVLALPSSGEGRVQRCLHVLNLQAVLPRSDPGQMCATSRGLVSSSVS